MNPISAIILTGGASRRMGQEKWSLEWPAPAHLLKEQNNIGWTLLDEVMFRIHPCIEKFTIVCAEHQRKDIENSVNNRNAIHPGKIRVICDEISHQGPLQGIYRGLSQSDPGWNFICGCDNPFITPRIINFLATKIQADSLFVIPSDQQYKYPLCGLYHSSMTPQLETQIAQGEHRLIKTVEALKGEFISTEELKSVDPELKCLINLNEPVLYRRMLEQEQQARKN